MNVLILFLYYEIFLIHIQDQINDFLFQEVVLLEELIDYLNQNAKYKDNKLMKFFINYLLEVLFHEYDFVNLYLIVEYDHSHVQDQHFVSKQILNSRNKK